MLCYHNPIYVFGIVIHLSRFVFADFILLLIGEDFGCVLGCCAFLWWFGLFRGVVALLCIIFLINILFACFCGKPWCTYQVLLSFIFVACSVL